MSSSSSRSSRTTSSSSPPPRRRGRFCALQHLGTPFRSWSRVSVALLPAAGPVSKTTEYIVGAGPVSAFPYNSAVRRRLRCGTGFETVVMTPPPWPTTSTLSPGRNAPSVLSWPGRRLRGDPSRLWLPPAS